MSAQLSRRLIPIIVGMNYEHVIGDADILVEGDEITITMKTKGNGAKDLGAFLASIEPFAVSFVAVPRQPHKTNSKESP